MTDPATPGKEREVIGAVRDILAGEIFRGVQLSKVVGPGLFPLFWSGAMSGAGPSRLRASLVLSERYWGSGWLERLRTWRHPGRGVRVDPRWKGRVAIEALGMDSRLAGFWRPVAREIGRSNCVLVAASPGAARFLPAGLDSVTLTLRSGWAECRRWIGARLGTWREAISGICRAHDLAPSAPDMLASEIVAQVLRVAQASALAEEVRPASYLSLWDQGSFGAPVCAAMNAAGIPTYTMVHGAIGRDSMADFTPLVARKVLVWGDVQRGLFRASGVPDESIHIVGCQRLPEERPCTREDRREKLALLGLAGEGPVVLVGMTVLRTTQREAWLTALGSLISAMPGTRFLIRLHPSNRRQQFPGLYAGETGVRVIESGELSLEESIALADMVLVDTSTLGFDALCFGRPVAVLHPYPFRRAEDILHEVIGRGGALYAEDSLEMASLMRSFWKDAAERLRQAEKARKFVESYVASRGEASASLVARAVLESSVGPGPGELGVLERE